MKELIRKALPYAFPAIRYWVAVPPERVAGGAYPLDFTRHLRQGHYRPVDALGLPVRPAKGALIRNYTRICGYGIANLQIHEASADPVHLARAEAVGRYVIDTGHRTEGHLELRAELPGAGHSGPTSAMSQGQAMSVLSRLYRLTQDDDFAQATLDCMGPFTRPVQDGGVVGYLRAANDAVVEWYEEETSQPLTHILNGMIFAIWGLIDTAQVLHSREAAALAENGLASVRAAATRFDSGRWSWYDLPDHQPPHPASASYHQLHVAQVADIARRTDDPAMNVLAGAFAEYERSAWGRIRAASDLLAARMAGGRRKRATRRATHDPG